ncbi:MAG: hypothetical protein ACSHX0_12310 [Akkermansiaceae bacterium]
MHNKQNTSEYISQLRKNIPAELQALACWMLSNNKGQPISPNTGIMSDVGNPENWGGFEQCLGALAEENCYVSFVLHESNPYTVIDLDDKASKPATDEDRNRHQQVVTVFNSYTEVSKSGRGYHIFVKGSIPRGCRRDSVEVYSNQRHMICTGDILLNNTIEERQKELDKLFAQIQDLPNQQPFFTYDNKPEKNSDEKILHMASNANNSDKFNLLMYSEIEAITESDIWESTSEADLALLGILCFYSPNNEQVERIYKVSHLARREKVIKRPNLISFNINKIRSQELPQIDLSQLKFNGKLSPISRPKNKQDQPSNITFPEGLVGEIANYIYTSSIRPVKEVALAAAIAFMAGICGRPYNISHTGLNIYIVLIADTGIGKEGAHTGIDTLSSYIVNNHPEAVTFFGPSGFASGQAIIRHTSEHNCYLTLQGEIGHLFKRICSPKANANDIMLQKVLLDLYGKSGKSSKLRPNAYSDKEKNTACIQAPCVSLLGDTTKSAFFDGLDVLSLTNGFIPRLLFIEYKGKRPPKNPEAFHKPSDNLISALNSLAVGCLNANNANLTHNVTIEAKANDLIRAFGEKADDKINESSSSEETVQIYNRAELKVLKLSGIVAVGVNSQNPIVTQSIVQWAISLVETEIASWQTHFDSGVLGGLEEQQHHLVRVRFEKYLNLTPSKRISSYKVAKSIADYNIVPYRYLQRNLCKLKSFTSSPRGAEFALDATLKMMKKCGEISEVSKQQLLDYGVTTPCYIIEDLN